MKVSAFPPLFLLLLIISLSGSCRLGTHAAADHHGHELEDFMVVATSSLEHTARDAAVCSGHKVMPSGDGVRWVPMNRPHGPCSSSPAVMEEDTIDDMLKWDQLRTSYIRRKLSGGGGGAGEDVNSDTTTSGVSEKNGMGVTAVNLGDAKCAAPAPAPTQSLEEASMTVVMPAARQTMVIDTSSDITWVQCLPCPFPQCHTQKDPFYDPAQSTTYAPIPCGSPACTRLGTAYGNGCSSASDQCRYAVDYGDGTATTGTYITDTLTLSPAIVVNHFQFGCSHAVKGSFSDQTAGVLALGGGTQSLLAQTAKDFGNAFSYCVPLPSSLGFLSLGGPVGASSRFARTPLIRNKRAPTFYIVRLEAITVAGKRLRVPPATFAAGAVMDSSAVVTQLPPPAYAALRAAFRTAMAPYGPLASTVRNLDTCYDFTRFTNNVTLPKVSLVFAGGAAVLDLDAPSLMLDGCLAFAPTPGGGADGSVGFIGNVQQQTYEVLYDVGGGSVGFRRAAC